MPEIGIAATRIRPAQGDSDAKMVKLAEDTIAADNGQRSFLRPDPLLRLSLETTRQYLSLRAKNGDERASSDLKTIEEASSDLSKLKAAHSEAKRRDIKEARGLAQQYYTQ